MHHFDSAYLWFFEISGSSCTKLYGMPSYSKALITAVWGVSFYVSDSTNKVKNLDLLAIKIMKSSFFLESYLGLYCFVSAVPCSFGRTDDYYKVDKSGFSIYAKKAWFPTPSKSLNLVYFWILPQNLILWYSLSLIFPEISFSLCQLVANT